MRFALRRAFWVSYGNRRAKFESTLPAGLADRVMLYLLAPSALVGALCLFLHGEAQTHMSSLFLCLVLLALGYFIFAGTCHISPLFMALLPLSNEDARYLETTDWERQVKSVKRMYLAAYVSMVPISIAALKLAQQDVELASVARFISLIGPMVTCALLLTCVFTHVVPRAKDVKTGVLDHRQYYNLLGTSAAGHFWTLFAILLAFLPSNLALEFLMQGTARSPIRDAVFLAGTLLGSVMDCLLWIVIGAVAAFYVLPWILLSGWKALAHLVVFTSVGVLSYALQRHLVIWAVATLAYILLVDTILGTRQARPGRRLWVFSSGIIVALIGLGMALLFLRVGIGQRAVPGVALALSFDLLLNVAARRAGDEWATAQL
jgi:hypothetical protein